MSRKMLLILSVMMLVAVSAFAQYNPPQNLTYEVTDDVVDLAWDEPIGAQPILKWGSGEFNGNTIGLNGTGGVFKVVARFTATELAPFDGMSLSQIEIFANHEPSSDPILYVWTGGSWTGDTGTPGTEVLNQTLTNLTWESYNTIDLSTPVTIDDSEELWFGYQVDDPGVGVYPVGCDDGPSVNYFGNVLELGGSWMSLFDANSDYDYNWILNGYVTDDRGQRIPLAHQSTPEVTNTDASFEASFVEGDFGTPALRNRSVTSYKIYRDGTEIAENDDPGILTYSDTGLTAGDYEYYVTAMWEETNESDPSNTVDVTVNEILYNPPRNLVATVAGVNAILQWEEPSSAGPPIDPVDSVEEGFESGEVATNWTILDEDGDGYTWEVAGSAEMETHTGDYCIASASYMNGVGALHPNNWLITPPVSIEDGYSLSVWACPQDGDWYQEHWEIWTSTTGYDTGDFDVELHNETFTDTVYHEVTYDLSSYDGEDVFFAFRHCEVSDMFWMMLDDIVINDAGGEAVLSLSDYVASQSEARRDNGVCYATPLRDRPVVDGYNVYRDGNFISSTTNLFYTDTNLAGGTYEYYVTAVYVGGQESEPSNTDSAVGENDTTVPGVTTVLGAATPNPFNPETSIAFSLEQTAPVTIEVYNTRGQHVKTLVNDTYEAGEHNVVWHGDDSNGAPVGSGMYFYKMRAGRYTSTKKMILLK